MILDTSAVYALLVAEPEAGAMASALAADTVRLISAANLVEITIVVEARYGPAGGRELDLLLHRAGVETVGVTPEQAETARVGYRRYGKGRHPASLNFGDTFAYALSRVSGEPLLFKGTDFGKTDVEVVEY